MTFRKLMIAVCAFLLASCGGLAGEPQIVATMPPITAAPTDGGQPTEMPDVALGAQVFAANCTRCHGASGKGDGELVQSGQVPPPADFTNPITAAVQIPLGYYSVITNGNIEKLMPPWGDALSQHERWSVALYTYTLANTQVQLAHGKTLFDANCADCDVSSLISLDATANLSQTKLIAAVSELPGFTTSSDADRSDAAAYVRSLALSNADSIGAIAATAEPASTAEPEAASTAEVVTGSISGQISNGSGGGSVPANLPMTLFDFDASFNQQQVTGTADADGSYNFSDVALNQTHTYVVTANYRDQIFASDILSGDALTADLADGAIDLPLTIYELTEDADVIEIDGLVTQVSVTNTSLEIAQVYNFINTSDRAYTTSQTSDDGRAISLAISLPPGAVIAGFPNDQNRFIVDAPNAIFYDTVPVLPQERHVVQVVYLIQYNQGAIIEQPLNYALDAPVRLLLTPQNVSVSSDQLQPMGAQTLGSSQYQSYGATLTLPTGSVLSYTLSGAGANAATQGDPNAPVVTSNNLLLIVGGVIVIAALLGGGLFVIASRSRSGDNQIADILLRQIAELDDEHEAGKIDDENYERQRSALKARLTALMERKQ